MDKSARDLISAEVLAQRVRSPENCVLPVMLDHQAERLGDKPLMIFDEGPTWSYSQTQRIARGTAAAFEELGIGRGDRVLVWLRDGPDIVRISLGLYYLGAVFVPLNPEHKGEILSGLIDYADAGLLVTSADLLPQLGSEPFATVARMIVLDADEPLPARLNGAEILAPDVLHARNRDPQPLAQPLQPWDVHTLFFTSGTTGVPKGVESTHAHCATMAIDGLRFLQSEDRFVTPCAYFHIGGAYAPWGIVAKGASMLVVGKFSTTGFWEQVRRHNATVALLIGVMCDFLMSRPQTSDDAKNPLRLVILQPLLKNSGEFAKRFGVDVYTQYDQTETPPGITSDLIDPEEEIVPGYCGEVRPGFEAAIVDEHDLPVPDGTSGELVLRCDVPWIIAPGYFRKPEQTVRAWKNGWYHTGDIFRRDAAGRFFFVDRSKDVIRRRGENISSFDIERALVAHPAIEAAAAFGVPSEHSEDEVMAVVQPVDGMHPSFNELVDHMRQSVPGFMVPRYMRMMAELPRSATDKVKKDELQREGVTTDTWDREGGAVKVAASASA